MRYQAEIHALHTACCSLMTGVTTSDSPHLCSTAASALYPKLHPRFVACLAIFESSLQQLSSGRGASGWLLVLLGGVTALEHWAAISYCHQHHSVFSTATSTIHSIFYIHNEQLSVPRQPLATLIQVSRSCWSDSIETLSACFN